MNLDPFEIDPPPPRPPLLRRMDQTAAGIVIGVALFLIGAYGWYNINPNGVIEIEPREIEFRVDLNSADWPELMNLPDLGETRARQIVEWRRENGPFVQHEDLLNIHGIGSKTLEKIRPHLRPIR